MPDALHKETFSGDLEERELRRALYSSAPGSEQSDDGEQSDDDNQPPATTNRVKCEKKQMTRKGQDR